MLKHMQRSTTKQSVYLRTSTVDIHAFTPAPLRKLWKWNEKTKETSVTFLETNEAH